MKMHPAVTQGKCMYGCVSVCTSVLFCCASVGLGKLLVQYGLEYIKQPIINRSLTDELLRALVNFQQKKIKTFSIKNKYTYACI
jgi:hypothetical protein